MFCPQILSSTWKIEWSSKAAFLLGCIAVYQKGEVYYKPGIFYPNIVCIQSVKKRNALIYSNAGLAKRPLFSSWASNVRAIVVFVILILLKSPKIWKKMNLCESHN